MVACTMTPKPAPPLGVVATTQPDIASCSASSITARARASRCPSWPTNPAAQSGANCCAAFGSSAYPSDCASTTKRVSTESSAWRARAARRAYAKHRPWKSLAERSHRTIVRHLQTRSRAHRRGRLCATARAVALVLQLRATASTSELPDAGRSLAPMATRRRGRTRNDAVERRVEVHVLWSVVNQPKWSKSTPMDAQTAVHGQL